MRVTELQGFYMRKAGVLAREEDSNTAGFEDARITRQGRQAASRSRAKAREHSVL